jgi:TonB family protein
MWIAFLLLLFAFTVPVQAQTASSGNLPEVVTFVAPAYPRYAKDHRMQGTATIRVTVAPDGRVVESKIVSAHPVFEKYVVAAVQQWKFKPLATPNSFEMTFRFAFYDDEQCQGEGEQVITPETFVSAELPDSVTIKTGLPCISTSTSWLPQQRHSSRR